MDPLSGVASIIAVVEVTGELLGYLWAVKEATRERQQLLREAGSLLGILTTLQNFVSNGTDEVESEWCRAVKLLEAHNGPLHQCLTALSRLAQRLRPEFGVHKARQILKWKFTKDEVKDALDHIARIISLAQLALEMDHVYEVLLSRVNSGTDLNRHLTLAVKRCTSDIWNATDEIRKDVATLRMQNLKLVDSSQILRASSVEGQFHKVLEWLSPTDYSVQFQSTFQQSVEGTGRWFLNNELFEQWLSHGLDLLHCVGSPGTGKTMLATKAVNAAFGLSVLSPPSCVAYAYFDYRQQSQTAQDVLANLLKQCLRGLQTVPDFLMLLRQKHDMQGTRPNFNELESALSRVLDRLNKVWLIVDALDECEPGQCAALLDCICPMTARSNVTLLVTSRPLPELEHFFVGSPTMEIVTSDEDITTFANARIRQFPLQVQSTPGLVDAIVQAIILAASGVFLLARLHLDLLQTKTTVRAVRQAIRSLPSGSNVYDQTYEHAIQRILAQPGDRGGLARQILGWIVCARREIRLVDLQHALAIEEDDEVLDSEGIPDKSIILSVCLGLVVCTEPNFYRRTSVRLVHHTAQEYFERTRQTWFSEAHLQIAKTCIIYLTLLPRSKKKVPTLPFSSYAVAEWDTHVQFAQRNLEGHALDTLARTATRLFRHEDILQEPRCGLMQRSGRLLSGVTPWHVLAARNMLQLYRALRKECDFSDSVTSDGRNPLMFAAEHGSLDMINALLQEQNTKVNLQDGRGYTAVTHAAKANEHRAIRLLAQSDRIDVNIKNCDGLTALFVAISSNAVDAATMLVTQSRADLNVRDRQGRTPLHHAIKGQMHDVVYLLIQHGADINLADDHGNTPIHSAVLSRCKVMLSSILRAPKADVNAFNIRKQMPLHYAVQYGWIEAVELLLVAGAVLDAQDETGSTPLSLSKRSDSRSSCDEFSATMLAKLVPSNSTAVLLSDSALVIDHKSVEALGLPYVHPNEPKTQDAIADLCSVVRFGSDEVLKQYLHNNRDRVNTRDADDWAPLWHAAFALREDTVRTLLTHGADLAQRDRLGRTLLSTAVSWEPQHVAIPATKLLLNLPGIDVSLFDSRGRSSLWYAAREPRKPLWDMIINHIQENVAHYQKSIVKSYCQLSVAARVASNVDPIGAAFPEALERIYPSLPLRTKKLERLPMALLVAYVYFLNEEIGCSMCGEEERRDLLFCAICANRYGDLDFGNDAAASYTKEEEPNSQYDGDTSNFAFAICSQCVDAGAWCEDRTHLLQNLNVQEFGSEFPFARKEFAAADASVVT